MMKRSNKQLKSPMALYQMRKKYGPGFVALSQISGRVLASGKDIKKVWDKVEKTKLFKENKVIFQHVPPPGTFLVYGQN